MAIKAIKKKGREREGIMDVMYGVEKKKEGMMERLKIRS
jgi:hypothetical protein